MQVKPLPRWLHFSDLYLYHIQSKINRKRFLYNSAHFVERFLYCLAFFYRRYDWFVYQKNSLEVQKSVKTFTDRENNKQSQLFFHGGAEWENKGGCSTRGDLEILMRGEKLCSLMRAVNWSILWFKLAADGARWVHGKQRDNCRL